MDPKVSRIVAGTVYGVRPSPKKSQRDGKRGGGFSLDAGEAPKAPPAADADHDSDHEHEPLHVSPPADDEVGHRIDLTA